MWSINTAIKLAGAQKKAQWSEKSAVNPNFKRDKSKEIFLN
jgi:hypothetical protein